MSIIKCKGCGGMTNTITCDWMDHDDYLPRKCYVKWVNKNPVKGCGYDDFKASVLKNPNKYTMGHLKWISDILKKGRV
jgi:hypothetical protein